MSYKKKSSNSGNERPKRYWQTFWHYLCLFQAYFLFSAVTGYKQVEQMTKSKNEQASIYTNSSAQLHALYQIQNPVVIPQWLELKRSSIIALGGLVFLHSGFFWIVLHVTNSITHYQKTTKKKRVELKWSLIIAQGRFRILNHTQCGLETFAWGGVWTFNRHWGRTADSISKLK